MRATLRLSLIVAVVLSAGAARAQQPVPANAPVAAPAAQAPAPPAQDNYTYEADGRRDPFVSAIGTGLEPKLASRRGIGPAGMLTADITVRGIMQSASGFTALVQGGDTKTYIMHAGDKLLDGTVKAITSDGLTVVQDVNDPLSLVKTREVRRPLRSKEDAKP